MEKTEDDTAANENASHEAVIPHVIEHMLLLEDGTWNQLPSHIQQTLEALRHKRPTKLHILRAMCYIISLESGFCPSNTSTISFNRTTGCFNLAQISENIGFVNEIPHDETVLLKLVLNEPAAENVYKLLMCELGDGICLTLSYKHYPGKSIYLSASRYVLNATLKDPSKCLNNLKELSYKLKEFIFTPIRNFALEYENGTFAGLTGMPSEVIWLILRKLDRISLKRLAHTCKQLNSEIQSFRNVKH